MTNKQRNDLTNLIEEKINEIYGDPDTGLQLKASFVAELRRRMKKKQRLVPHSAVMKKYGLR